MLVNIHEHKTRIEMKRIFIALVLVSFCFTDVEAVNIDSLKAELHKAGTKAAQVDALLNLSQALAVDSAKTSGDYSRRALSLAEEIGDSASAARAVLYSGIASYYAYDYDEALDRYFEYLDYSDQYVDKKGRSDAYNNIGIIYKNKGDYKTAIDYHLKALKLREELDDPLEEARSLNNLGTVYYYLGNLDKALEFYTKSAEIKREVGDSASLASTYNNLGMINADLEQYDKAIKYYKLSLDLERRRDFPKGIATTLTNLGNAYSDAGQLEKAKKHYDEAIEIDESIENHFGLLFGLINSSILESDLGNFREALYRINRAIFIAESNDYSDLLNESYRVRSAIYSSTGDFERALKDYKEYHRIKDSLTGEALQEKIAELQIKYETEKNEKEKKLLELAKRDAIIARQKAYKTVQLWSAISISAFFVMLAVIAAFFYAFRQKNRHNAELERKNEEITVYNRELEKVRKELVEDSGKILKLNEDLINSEEKLKEISAAKDKFLSIVAHDIKNPLTGILTSTALLTKYFDKLDKEKILRQITILGESGKNLNELLDNLLQWSRSQSGKIERFPTEFSLRSSADTCVKLSEQTAKLKNVEILNEVSESADAFADANMIVTVLRNLLSNAVKYSNPGDTVRIKSFEYQGFTKITVEDEGIGIPEEIRDDLFKLRSNGKASFPGTSNEKGSGLGLLLCKEFVELNGGTIDFESEPGKGTKFHFTVKNS